MDIKTLEALGLNTEELAERVVDQAVHALLHSTGFNPCTGQDIRERIQARHRGKDSADGGPMDQPRAPTRKNEESPMKIDVLCRFTGRILYSHEAENNTLRLTLEAAANAGADLAGADLAGAKLAGADLAGADLTGADLTGAKLAGAKLARADLTGAKLAGADLAGADLTGAKLRNGEVLTGERPVVQVGPIGSRGDYLVAYVTDQGLRFDAGCQRQISRDMLESRIDITHGTNKYAQEYRAALAFIDAHAAIWGFEQLTQT